MKKIIKFIAVICLLVATSFSTAVNANDDIQVVVNGELVEFDVMPLNMNDRVMVPFRAIFEALGADVTWNNVSQTVFAEKDGYYVKIGIDSLNMYVNNERELMDVAPVIVDGRTLVSARFVAEAFGCDVQWNQETKTVFVSSDGKELPSSTNRYNNMGYVDISGLTIQDMADNQKISLSDFLSKYGLPENMPADTTESAAYYTIPVKIMAQMYGMDYETMKETLNFPDYVTEDTPWGDAEGEVTLEYYIGIENIQDFKDVYFFGDEITADTKWKEVRYTVDWMQKTYEVLD